MAPFLQYLRCFTTKKAGKKMSYRSKYYFSFLRVVSCFLPPFLLKSIGKLIGQNLISFPIKFWILSNRKNVIGKRKTVEVRMDVGFWYPCSMKQFFFRTHQKLYSKKNSLLLERKGNPLKNSIPWSHSLIRSCNLKFSCNKKLISCLELWEKRVRVGKIGCLAGKNIAPLGKMLLAMMDKINNSARVGKHVSLAGKNVIRPRTIFALAGKNTRENNCAWEK